MVAFLGVLGWALGLFGSGAPQGPTGSAAVGPTHKGEQPAKPTGKEPPPVVPKLLLPKLDAVTLEPGQKTTLDVRVQRQDCRGAVRLELQGLPAGVSGSPVTLAEAEDTGRLTLTAGDDAAAGTTATRVRARLDAVEAEQEVVVTVKVVPRLRLTLPAAVRLVAGESQKVNVLVQRQHCRGDVRLGFGLGQLPAGVTAAERTVRLAAYADDARAEGDFRLTVVPPALPLSRDDNRLKMKLALIKPGKYTRGSPDKEEGRFSNEGPRHEVEITQPFYMGVHEVTVGQFKAFVNDKPYKTEAESDGQGGHGYNATTKKFEGRDPKYTWKAPGFPQADDHPVVNVTWNDAVAFCKWLSDKEGKPYDLPTEAEWEFACRAGTTTRFWHGDDEDGLKAVANIADASFKEKYPDGSWAKSWDDGYPFTAPVGRFKANAWGLHDMHGNVWEWCGDYYGKYEIGSFKDPKSPENGDRRVLRGGSWGYVPRGCRAAYRGHDAPSDRSFDIGFRVVLLPAPRAR